jgi:hypothetical protein
MARAYPHSRWGGEGVPFTSSLASDDGTFESLADLFTRERSAYASSTPARTP